MLLIVLYDWANSTNNNRAIYIIYAVLILVSVVNIYVHLEYYIVNKGVKLCYNKNKNIIKYKRKDQEQIILPSKVERIEIHQSRFYKKKNSILTTDNYRFYKFILEGNRTIIITSLLYPDFEYKLEGITEIKEKIVASILV